MKCSMSQADEIEILVLTFYYSFAISILRASTRVIFSITDVSHINMIPYQTPGNSNQALLFMRDVKIFASGTDILAKKIKFWTTPLWENGSVLEILYLGTL